MKKIKLDPVVAVLLLLIVFSTSCLAGLIIAKTYHHPELPRCDNIRALVTSKTIQNNKCTLYSNGSLFVCTEWVYSEVRVGHSYTLQFDSTQSIHRIVIRAIEE